MFRTALNTIELFNEFYRVSVGSVPDIITGGRWFKPPARPIYFPRIDDSHSDRIHSPFTPVRCFDNGYVGKQPIAGKEHGAAF